MNTKQQLKTVLKHTIYNNSIINKYLKGRGLKPNKDFGYIPYLDLGEVKGVIANSLVMPIKNLNNKIVGVEIRSLYQEAQNRYSKILKEDMQIYNLKNTLNKKVIITEGILDCETLHQHSDLQVISCLRAKPPKTTLHYIASQFNNVVIWFDKDSTGKEGAKEVKNFYKRYYPKLKVNLYKHQQGCKDINDLYMLNKKEFNKTVKELEKI